MGKVPLTKAIADEIENKVRVVWDFNKTYWYPLFACERIDVIAFNSAFIHIPEKLQHLNDLLKDHGVKSAYEFWEDGSCFKIP